MKVACHLLFNRLLLRYPRHSYQCDPIHTPGAMHRPERNLLSSITPADSKSQKQCGQHHASSVLLNDRSSSSRTTQTLAAHPLASPCTPLATSVTLPYAGIKPLHGNTLPLPH